MSPELPLCRFQGDAIVNAANEGGIGGGGVDGGLLHLLLAVHTMAEVCILFQSCCNFFSHLAKIHNVAVHL